MTCGDADDFFALEGADFLGAADVLVDAVSQTVVVAFAPRVHRAAAA